MDVFTSYQHCKLAEYFWKQNCFWRGCFLHREEITMKRIYSQSLPRNISLSEMHFN